jgi:endonuclease YncB( thermonuclease family)
MRKGALAVALFALSVLTPTPSVFSRTNPPAPSSPSDGQSVADFGPVLEWLQPAGTTQNHVQVVPFNNDGPGVNLIISPQDPSLPLPPPPQWYGLLPDMTYSWRVRASDASVAVGTEDASWSDWSPQWTFRTPALSAASISPAEPASDSTVATLTPTLVWAESNPNAWYYEVQISRDPGFGAGAFLYWELRHGGVTTPPRSYTVPSPYPLEPGQRYYWRVRTRVQGDGSSVLWSQTWTFQTQGGGAAPDGQVTAILDGATIEVIIGGQRKQVRYLGINVPRVAPAECYGAQAAARNSELVEGQTVRLEKDQTEADGSGRLLRYVFVREVLVNADLLAQGLGRANVSAPDTRYGDLLRGKEAEARGAKRGLWGACQ